MQAPASPKRRGRYDMSEPSVMNARRLAQQARRQQPRDYVIGRFHLINHHVVLFALITTPAFEHTDTLSADSRSWSRWSSRQTAWHYLNAHPNLPSLRPIHLTGLDVHP